MQKNTMKSLLLPEETVESFTRGVHPIVVNTETIDRFLQQDHGFELDDSELLRRLAISLELEDFTDGWDGLRGIYDAAEQANPQNVQVLVSRAISAMEWSEQWRTSDLGRRTEIAFDAEQAIVRALTLSSHDADLLYVQGLVHYDHPSQEETDPECVNKALHSFMRAIAADPCHQMARLYKAHCHHDLRDWPSAYEAYLQVDCDALLSRHPEWSWRVFKCREQLALCAARLGRIQEAEARFNDLFDEIESLSAEEATGNVTNLDEAFEAFREVLQDSPLVNRFFNLVEILYLSRRYDVDGVPCDKTFT